MNHTADHGLKARGIVTTALLILAFTFAANAVLRGLQDSYAVFVLPISEDFGWPRAAVSSVYSITFATVGLSGPLVGWLFDRWGPLRLYLLGVTAAAAGCALCAQADALWQFYLALGLLFGLGAASVGYVPMAALLSRWFRERLNTAMAVGLASHGIGILLLAPAAQLLIDAFGWRQAYLILALVVLGLLPLFLLVPWRQAAAGHPAYRAERAATGRAGSEAPGPILAEAARTAAFWGIALSFFFTSLAMFSVSLQTPAYLAAIGYSVDEAAGAFGLLGLLLPIGMIGFGWLGDRIGRRRAALISYTITFLGILCLVLLRHGPSPWLLGGFVLAFGATFGSRGPAISTIAARLFGGAHFGRIYGCATALLGIGGATGAWLGGFLFDATGGYLAGHVAALVSIAFGAAPFVLVPAIART